MAEHLEKPIRSMTWRTCCRAKFTRTDNSATLIHRAKDWIESGVALDAPGWTMRSFRSSRPVSRPRIAQAHIKNRQGTSTVSPINQPFHINTDTGANDTMAKKNFLGKPQSHKSNGARKSSSKACDPKKLRYTAVHEAGHAVLAVILGFTLENVFIKECPRTGVLVGFTHLARHTADDLAGKGGAAALPYLIQCFAGPRAERNENPAATQTFAYAMDQQDAYHVAHLAIFGLTCSDYAARLAICESIRWNSRTIGPIPAELRRKEICRARILVTAWLKAGKLLEEHWEAVLEVAALLRQKKKLTGEKVVAIVNAFRAVPGSNPPQPPAPYSAIPAPSPAR
jgi:hypothetical protein